MPKGPGMQVDTSPAGGPSLKGPAGSFRPDPAAQKGGDQLAHLGRTRRAKRGGTNWAIGAGPGGPKGGGTNWPSCSGKSVPKKWCRSPPDPLASPPLGTVTFSEDP